jgi:hypothetical protein
MTKDSVPDQIWYYTSLPALLSILQRSKLWFTTLAMLEDPFEGRFDCRWYKRLSEQEHEELVRRGSVHCWHLGKDSDLMWKVYAPDIGVAIQSTTAKLEESFRGKEKDKVLCQPVKYCSALSYPPDPFKKRQHYEGEGEFRAYLPIKVAPSEDVSSTYLPEAIAKAVRIPAQISTGCYVDIEPKILIEAIWVSPYAPPWYDEVLEETLERYDYRSGVKRRQNPGK